MVRVYKKKSNRAESYTAEQLNQVVDLVKTGTVTVFTASKRYRIPYSTLQKHVAGKRGIKSKTQGRPPVIPEADELVLANGIKAMEKWGWGLSRKEILEIVGVYTKKNNLSNPFKSGIPGEDWFLNFKKRHNLSLKKPQTLEYARKKATDPFIIEEYFDLLKKTLDELQLNDKPEQIYNIDESSFCLDPTKSKIVGLKNRPASRVTSGPGRENTTVLMGGSAAGEKLPPLIVYKGKNIWDTWLAPDSDTFPGTAYAASPNGWMETKIFINYFKKTFIRNAVKQRPLLMIYDGHSSHLDLELIKCAMDNNITILKLPPHTSHLLQPMDLAVFKSLKTRWESKIASYQRTNLGQKIPKREFSILIGQIWREASSDLLKSGFRKGGIYPYNRNVIEPSKYDPEMLRRYERSKKEKMQKSTLPLENLELNNEAGPSSAPDGNTAVRIYDSTAADNTTTETNVSFESLLLSTIKQSPRPSQIQKRKKIVQGAEVITSTESYAIKKSAEEKKAQLEEDKAQKKIKGKGNKRKKTKAMESCSSSEDEIQPDSFMDSEDENQTYSDYVDDTIREQLENESDFEKDLTARTPKVGSWVLVQFYTKKSKFFYVGQVTKFAESKEPIVTFLKKTPNSKSTFNWPDKMDESEVLLSDVEKLLPEPQIGRRGELTFPLSFDAYNVK